ncbi:MAG: hypothetical protein RIQ71_1895, partial [Verrucomicrobiota bacterium]
MKTKQIPRRTAISRAIFLLTLFLLVFTASDTIAQTYTTNTFTTGTAWLTPGNWSAGSVPVSNSVVRFTNASTLAIGLNGNSNNSLVSIAGFLFSGNATNSISNSSSSVSANNSNAAIRLFGWVENSQTNLIVNDSTSGHLIITNGNAATTNATIGRLPLVLMTGGVINVSNVGAQVSLMSEVRDSAGTTNTITKTGAGTLTLGGTNANTFGGGVILNAGTLNVSKASALGTGSLTINGGTLGNSSGANLTAANSMFWSNSFSYNSANLLNFNGGVTTISTNLTVTVSGGALQLNGVNSGGYGLTKAGSGTLTFGSGVTNLGGVTVSAGTLGLGASQSSLAGLGTVTMNGGSLASVSSARTITNSIVAGGDFAFGGSGSSLIISNLDLGGVTRIVTLGNSLTVNGAISNGGLTIDSTNSDRKVTLSNTATYTGPTTIKGGALIMGTAGLLSSNSALDISAATTAATNDISGISGSGMTVASLAGGANGALVLGAKNLTVGANNTTTTFAGVASGTGGSITKNGTGTMTFTGTSTYDGATTVSGGGFVMNGTNSSSAVTLANGASLGGSGRIGALTLSGMVSPGNSVGTLSAGNTIIDAGSSFQLEMYDWSGSAGTGWDLLSSSGSLTLSNTSLSPFTVNLVSMSATNTSGNSINWNANQNWTNNFITYTSLVGTFNSSAFSVNTNSFSNTLNGTFSIVTNGNALALLYTTAYVPATTFVWNAGSGDWSSTGNWQGGTAPTNDSAIVFSGPAGVATNNAVVTSAVGITFSNTTGSIALAGDALAIGVEGIVNLATDAHTISNNISFATNVSVNASAGALTIAGNMTNDVSGQTLTFLGANNTTVSGVVSGQGGLSKSGTGSLILSGANNYTGGTTVTGGTLSGDSTSITGAVTNGAGATVTFNQSTNGTFAGVVSGAGRLTKSGDATLTLSGANNYNGGTLVSAGALAGSTASLQGAITNNAGVIFDQTTNGTYAGLMSGNGVLTKNSAGTVTLSGANTYSGGTVINAGKLAGDTRSLQGAITNGSVVEFSQSTNGTYSGVVSGAGSLVKSGSGTVTLSGANTYSGGTVISAGTLTGDTISLQGAISNAATLAFSQATNGTYSGVISGTGGVSKGGSGTLTFDAVHSYTGLTTITTNAIGAGALALSGAGSIAASSGVDLIQGVVFDISGVSAAGTTVQSISGNTTSTIFLGSKTLTFGNSASNTFPGTITGTGGLIKTGSGYQSFSNNSTYSGGFTLQDGVVRMQASSVLATNAGPVTNILSSGFGTGTLTVQGGRIQSSSGSGRTIHNSVNMAGNFAIGATDSNGAVTVSAATTGAATTLTTNATITTDASAIWLQTITGGYTLTKAGAATLTLGATNTIYSGSSFNGLTVSAGTVRVYSSNTINSISVAGGAGLGYGTVAYSPFGSATITLNDGSAFGQDTSMGGGTDAERTIANNIVLNGNATFGGFGQGFYLSGNIDLNGGSRTITFSNSTTFSGVISNGTGLVLDSGGSTSRNFNMTNATATYSGPTTVNGGNLILQGSGALASGTALNVAGTTTNAGFNISGLSGAGTTIGSLAVASNSSVALGSKTLSVGGDNTSTTVAGSISGTNAGLTKSGNGVLTLSGSNTYTGTTTINGGTILLTNGNALADSSTVVLSNASGASLDVRSSETIGSISGGGNTGGNVALASGSTLTVAEAGSASYAGALSGSGSLAKSGSGTITLSGNSSSYSGATTINSGSVVASANTALGTGAVNMTTASLVAGNGITLGNDIVINSALVTGTNFTTNSFSGYWNFGTVTNVGSAAVTTTNGSGVIYGDVLQGNTLGTATMLGTTSASTGYTDASGNMNAGNVARTNALVTGASGSAYFEFTLTPTAGTSLSLTNFTVGSRQSGSGPLLMTLLSSLDSYTSALGTNALATDSIWRLIAPTVSASAQTNGAVTFRIYGSAGTGNPTSGTINWRIDDLNVYGASVAGTLFTNTLGGSAILGITEAGSATYTGNVSISNSLSSAVLTAVSGGQATFSGVISGAGSVTKTGSGTVTLAGSAANTFSGATTVSAGTLELASTTASSLGSTASVSVASGATLLVSQANQVNNSASVSLTGGTIRTASGVSEVFGNLSVTSASFLDFGTTSYANANSISFGTYSPSALLTINNFDFGSTLVFKTDLSGSITNSSF